MLLRREFLKSVAAVTAATAISRKPLGAQTAAADGALLFSSGSIEAQLSPPFRSL